MYGPGNNILRGETEQHSKGGNALTKLRMGIIGTGMAFEKLHYPAYEMLIDKYKIVALCDLDPVKTEKWIRRLQLGDEDAYTDYRAMMKRPDIDAFDIMVPISSTIEQISKPWNNWG
jgi:predicted dehydrogenase